ncbi:MAG TPA: hypothetical protein VKA48_08590 [Gammaproteobacteria bacterium]|nr:hypothetical protein [Gammaproteobacteria bacterium]
MRQVSWLLIATILACGAGTAQAGAQNQISIGSKSLTIAYSDSTNSTNDDLSGLELSYTRGIGDIAGGRIGYYRLTHRDDSNLKASGLDLKFLLGKNIARQGFKAYGGLGYFDETWERGSYSHDFSGLSLFGGIGYNGSRLALDFLVELRDASDYQKYVNRYRVNSVTASAASASLNLGVRF